MDDVRDMTDDEAAPTRVSLDEVLLRVERQERRIAQLEAELRHARAELDRSSEPTRVDPARASRRGLIIGAGAAAAAVLARSAPVAADVVATVSGSSSVQVGLQATPTGVTQAAASPSTRAGVIGRAEEDSRMPSLSVPVGTYGSSVTGYGMLGESTSGFAGVGGFSETRNGIYGSSISGAGAQGQSQSGTGVQGTSDTGRAIWGLSSNGVGGDFSGRQGALLLSGGRPVPSARTNSSFRGVIDTDADGGMWVCIASGTPGTWRKVAGPGTAGAYHPVTPGRVYDSRLANPTGSVGVLASGQSRTISVADRRDLTTGVVDLAGFVPAGATAITANVGVVDTVGSGFVAVNPGGTVAVSAASINWFASGQILNNGQNLTLNATREVTLIAGGGGSTHVVIDVTGYYL